MAAGSLLPPVVAVLMGNIADFSAKMGEAKGEMAGVEGTAGKMGALGKTALLGLAAGAVAVGVESVKMATSFQSTMELIATQAHAGQGEVDKMKQAVLDLAPTVGIGPEKLAEGLYHVESTGLRGQAALDVLKASAQEAALGMADFDSVTYAMSGVMSVAMKDVKDAADGVAYLNTIVGTGDMHMQDLAQAIGTGVLPAFKEAQLGMRDFGASITVLTDNSMPAEVAANHLRTAVALLQNQSGPATKALASIGIEQGQLARDLAKPDGLLVAMEDLKSHLENSGKTAVEQGQIISKSFGGAKSASTIETLVGEIDKLKGKYQEMGSVGERAKQQQDDWANAQNTFKQKMNEVGAQFQVWAIEIGQVLLPVLSKMADWFMGSVKWLGAHKEVLFAIGAMVLPLIASGFRALAKSAIDALEGIGAAIKSNPIGLLASIVALVVYEIITHWDQIKKALGPFAGWVKREVIDPVIRAWDALLAFLRPIGQWINTNVVQPIVRFWHALVDWTRGIWPDIQQIIEHVLNGLKDFWEPFWKVLQALFAGFVAGFKAAWDPLKAFFKDAWDVISSTFKFAWDIITTVFKSAWQIISGVVSGIIKVIKGIIDFVVGIFSGDWKRAWNGVKEVFSGIWDGIKGILGGVWSFITGIFKGAGTWLWNAGKAILEGLWNGLKSVWSGITNFFGGIGKWISDHKGPIDYDRKLLIPHGNAIMDGFHEGLLSGGKRVQGFINDFTTGIGHTAINGAFSISAGGAVGGGAGGTQQIVIQMNSRDMQTWLQTGILRYNLRNSSNGLAVSAS
ncbi:phage tail tape measure protein [Amycolatopsis benzoatilytica]|uniref:phage tail tape measure protein n=1 Tax=Amycolatopsis benzoatilytica TaxID=346045 RepID=UPI00037977BE|nr:phage tail tape measure protein [Amycolatopsis benzoatilytica]